MAFLAQKKTTQASGWQYFYEHHLIQAAEILGWNKEGDVAVKRLPLVLQLKMRQRLRRIAVTVAGPLCTV